jgi:hypothetical protein
MRIANVDRGVVRELLVTDQITLERERERERESFSMYLPVGEELVVLDVHIILSLPSRRCIVTGTPRVIRHRQTMVSSS